MSTGFSPRLYPDGEAMKNRLSGSRRGLLGRLWHHVGRHARTRIPLRCVCPKHACFCRRWRGGLAVIEVRHYCQHNHHHRNDYGPSYLFFHGSLPLVWSGCIRGCTRPQFSISV